MGCIELCGGVHTAQRQISTQIPIWFCSNLLPSATKLRRLCFYTCLSVHGGGGAASVHAGIPTPPPGANTPLGADSPPSRRLLLRTVRILLECILVGICVRLDVGVSVSGSVNASFTKKRNNKPLSTGTSNGCVHSDGFSFVQVLSTRLSCRPWGTFRTPGSARSPSAT